MLAESFVAIMALSAAWVLDPDIYFAVNAPAAAIGATSANAAQVITGWGFTITPEMLDQTVVDIGENSILSHAGGEPTLAVGMAQILAKAMGGKTIEAFWYHFVILFEALFIVTAVDAGTRVGRCMIQDMLGHVYRRWATPICCRPTCSPRCCVWAPGATSSIRGSSIRSAASIRCGN